MKKMWYKKMWYEKIKKNEKNIKIDIFFKWSAVFVFPMKMRTPT